MTLLFALFACHDVAQPSAPMNTDRMATAKASVNPTSRPTALPPETDLPYAGTGAWTLSERTFTLDRGVLTSGDEVVLRDVYHAPLPGPGVLWVPADLGGGDGGIYAVRVSDGVVTVDALRTAGRPDRLQLSPDGTTLLYVAGDTGITSLWALPVEGGAPRQITNIGVTRPQTPGQPPAGFVPPPDRTPLVFDGDRVTWTARGGTWEARWR